MKIAINEQKQEHFRVSWEGQYEVFSHFEFVCGIPSALFAIGTYKKNGKPNVCFHAWSAFQGEGDGYYVILAGISKNCHTYKNVLRDKSFTVNFLSKDYYDALIKTIFHNKDEDNEFLAGGFTAGKAETVNAPVIEESFLTLECELAEARDLFLGSRTVLILGKAKRAVLEDSHAHGVDKKYGPEGFMFNIHSPIDLKTGEGEVSAVATMKIEKLV